MKYITTIDGKEFSVEIIDDYTVKWHFKRPWGAFLGTMASVPGFMISQKALIGDQAISESKRLQRLIVTAKRKLEKAEEDEDEADDKGPLATDAARKKVHQAEDYLNDLEETLPRSKRSEHQMPTIKNDNLNK